MNTPATTAARPRATASIFRRMKTTIIALYPACRRSSMLVVFFSSPCVCSPCRMKKRHNSGVSRIATTNETHSATATATGSAPMNSPTEPVNINSGRKDAMIVNVAVSTGTSTSRTHCHPASARGTPRSRQST